MIRAMDIRILAAIFLGIGVTAGSSVGAKGAAAPAPGGWVRIEPKPVRIDGRLVTPTCSGAPGADPAYAFWFQQGTTDDLVVFFDGGGACWDDETCSKPRLSAGTSVFEGGRSATLYKAMILASDDPAKMSGLFDAGDPRNPVRAWSKIFVPYCTGDVHSGSNTASYTDPKTGQPFKVEHRGRDNAQVVRQWIRKNVDKPARILVTGSSAGSYGAAMHFGDFRGLFPRARAYYLGDAGMGVTTPAFAGPRDGNWGYRLPSGVFGADAARLADGEVVARLAARFPSDRFAQYTTARDSIQVGFYGQQGGPRTENAWTDKMLRELAERQQTPNFRAYVADGTAHTILRAPAFYTERSGGAPFAEWLGALLGDGDLPANECAAECRALRPLASPSP